MVVPIVEVVLLLSSHKTLWRQADALASVAGFCAHIEDAIRHTPAEKISRSRIVDRWLKNGTIVGQGCITVAGDALHPMTPSLGQGGCIALEVGTTHLHL